MNGIQSGVIAYPEAERVATAHHEAGHTAMGYILGRRPLAVDIEPDQNGNAGHTHFESDVPARMKSWFDQSEAKKTYLAARVLIEFAGTAAHDLFSPGRSHDIGDQLDAQHAAKMVGECMSWDNDHPAYLKRLELEAVDRLKAHWSWIEAIAAALLAQPKLSRDELDAIIVATPAMPKT